MSDAIFSYLVWGVILAAMLAPPILRAWGRRSRRAKEIKKRGLERGPTLALWRDVARERRGVLDPAGTTDSSVESVMEVAVGDVVVRLELRPADPAPERRATGAVEYALASRASLLVPAGPVFRLGVEDVASKLLTAVGGVDVTLGHDKFDRRFVIRSETPALTRAMWSEETARLMLRSFPDGSMDCDGERITLWAVAPIDTRRRIEAALDLVGKLAGADLYGLGALKELPGARSVKPRGPWNHRTLPFCELDDAVKVMLGPVPDHGEAVTRVEIEDVAWDLDLRLEDVDGTFDTTDLVLPPGTAELLAQVGAGTLMVDERWAAFKWREVVTDRARLLAGVRLVAAFGVAAGQTAYR